MGAACGTYEGEEKFIFKVWWKIWKKREHLPDLGVNERILKWTLNKWNAMLCSGSCDSGRGQVAGSVNMMNLRFP
jgi:hypothetical protein